MLRRLALLAAAATGVPLAIAWIVSQTIMHPKPRVEDHGLDDFGLEAEDISFASRDGTRIAGWFIAPSGPTPTPAILLSHGWARSRGELMPHANFLHRAGYAVLMFDYRHRGESEGDAITFGVHERRDLQAALDTLSARPEVDPGRIAVLGMSMGGVIATVVAAGDERVRALMLECPFSTHDGMLTQALQHYGRLPSFPFAVLAKRIIEQRVGESLSVAEPARFIARFSPRPVFIIAAERDEVIGSAQTEELFRLAGEPKRYWFIPGAEHARGWQQEREEYERRVLAFFEEAVAERTAAASAG